MFDFGRRLGSTVNWKRWSPVLALTTTLTIPKVLHLQEHPLKQHQYPSVNNSEVNEEDGIPIYRPYSSASPRPHVVILGTGWGAVSLVKNLSKSYNLTVVSPHNYFLFTPLLPSGTVGTVQLSSLAEPIRNILYRAGWPGESYIEASAVTMNIPASPKARERKLILCQGSDGRQFYIPYDKCVIAVGSRSITWGVPGVNEYCHFLKSINDVRKIRSRLLANFERASLPTVSDDERKKLLSFVVCGGGPTGVEFAGELYDLVTEDMAKYFPHLREFVQVYIIQSQDHILNTYDLKISKYAEDKFMREGINVLTRSRVMSVSDGIITYSKSKKESSAQEEHKIPFGLCIWTTGIGMQPFTESIANKIDSQMHSRALMVDEHMRVKGAYQGPDADHGDILALGDCSAVMIPRLRDSILDMFKSADANQSDSLNFEEFQKFASVLKKKHPLTEVYLQKLTKLFAEYDADHNGDLSFEEFKKMVLDLEKKLKAYPATAQVAQQQGTYVAHYLNWMAENEEQGVVARHEIKASSAMEGTDQVETGFPAFKYSHFGSLAYLGSSTAALDFGGGLTMPNGGWFGMGRIMTFWLWRSVYLSEVVSLRQRVRLGSDWTCASMFGREVSRFG